MTKARDLANFTASTGVVDADIGSTVQAYDSNLTSFVGVFTLPTTDGTTGQLITTNGSGVLSFSSVSGGAQAFVTQSTGVNVAPGTVNDSFAII